MDCSATEAWQANDRVHHAEYSFNILDRHNLAEMVHLLPAADDRCSNRPQRSREFGEHIVHKIRGSGEAGFGIIQPPSRYASAEYIRCQVLRIVLRLQIPLTAITMLCTKLTHT
jgi:hypothetical protein